MAPKFVIVVKKYSIFRAFPTNNLFGEHRFLVCCPMTLPVQNLENFLKTYLESEKRAGLLLIPKLQNLKNFDFNVVFSEILKYFPSKFLLNLASQIRRLIFSFIEIYPIGFGMFSFNFLLFIIEDCYKYFIVEESSRSIMAKTILLYPQ